MKKTKVVNEKTMIVDSTRRPIWRSIVNDIIMVLIIVPLALLIKSYTVELFKIPTGSMEPTLYGANDMGRGFGDHILVLRFVYGLSSRIKVPLLNWHVPLPEFRLMLPGMRHPRVGEVVVFENPVDPNIDYIKRCAGTPGDHVRIEAGRLYVNDEIVTNSPATATYVVYRNQGLLCDRFVSVRKAIQDIMCRERTDAIKDSVHINGRPYRDVEREVDQGKAKFHPTDDTITSQVVVPSGSYFMLGDNSASSLDSRFWGFVPLELIKGKAWCVYFPIKRMRVVR